MKLLFRTLHKQELKYKGFLFIFLLMTLLVSIASVLVTRLTGDLGQAAVDMEMGVLFRLFLILTGITLVRAIASAVSALLLGRFAGKAGYRFRENFAKYFLQKPFAAYDGIKTGESLSVFSNDLPGAVELVSGGGIRMIGDVISLLVTFVYMLYLNWWLTLIYFATFPVLIVLQVVIAGPIQKKSEKRLAMRANATAVGNDAFQNASTVMAYSLEELMRKRVYGALNEWVAATKRMARSYLLLIMAGVLASCIPMFLIIGISANQVIQGQLPLAEWIAFTALAMETSSWLADLSQRQNQVQTAAGGAKRLDEHMTSEIEDIHVGDKLEPKGSVALAARNLSFSYQGEEGEVLALDNVSFEIPQYLLW